MTFVTGWGRTTPARADVWSPGGREEIAEALAQPPPRGIVLRGLGRSYGDVASNSGGLVLDLTGLTRVLAFDAEVGVVTVEAGLSLAALADLVLPHGWFLPVSPGTRWVTVGGAIANDVHGKNHHVDGSFGHHVERLTLATPRGEMLSLGPGSDEFDATVGGLGLTGAVLDATIRLLRVESAEMTVDVETASSLDGAIERLEATDASYRYSVAWIDTVSRGARFGRGVLMQGDHAPAGEAAPAPPPLDRPPRLSVPSRISAAPALRSPALEVFNELYFRRARPQRGRRESIPAFFYPLDALGEWNRLYGSGGFLQYQFVVPHESVGLVGEILGRLRAAGVRMPLTVLKRFGRSHGLIAFTGPGWTAAIDVALPAPGLGPVLDEIDGLVADAGGSVYLAKDARLRPDTLRRMLPRLDEWRRIRDALDPDRVLRSDLARRLHLVEDRQPLGVDNPQR